jgi:hypothetical protein
MIDQDLAMLTEAAERVPDPVDSPPDEAIRFLEALDLDEDDLETLLGDAAHLSVAEVRANGAAIYFRVRTRMARLICTDAKLKTSVRLSLAAGGEAAWLALLGVTGLNPATVAAAALKPIAVGIVVSGVERLCITTPSDRAV